MDQSTVWRARNKPRRNVLERSYYRKNRDKVLDILGGKCIRCGFDDRRALQVDHINGGGNKERLIYGSDREINRAIANGKIQHVQLLCANCNCIKRVENNE